MTTTTFDNGVTRGRALSLLVHSDTKVGKTTLGGTSPKPMLLLDAEAAYRFLPYTKVFWDPISEQPPIPDGTWEVCVVVVRDYTTMVRAVEWLKSGQHRFKSVVIDSISEIQKRCIDQIAGMDQMDQRKWGELLRHMEGLVRDVRDLTEHRTMPLESVVITAMTKQMDGKWRPYVQGALATTMPYFLDVVGYLFVARDPGPDPTVLTDPVRRLLVENHPQFEAGERVQGRLGATVDNPTVPSLLDKVFGAAS